MASWPTARILVAVPGYKVHSIDSDTTTYFTVISSLYLEAPEQRLKPPETLVLDS